MDPSTALRPDQRGLLDTSAHEPGHDAGCGPRRLRRPRTERSRAPAQGGGIAPTAARPRGQRHGNGAGTIRLFGLLLTVFLVTTVCEVAIDLVGAQCYQGNQVECTNLPSLMEVFASWGPGPRLALFSVVPVLLMLGLWQLTRISSERYEATAIGQGRVTENNAPVAEKDRPATWLTQPQFWDGHQAVGRLTVVHMAAGLLVVTISTALPAMLAAAAPGKTAADKCRRFGALPPGDCWDQVREVPTAQWLTLLGIGGTSLLLLIAAAVLVVRLSGDAPDLCNPTRRTRAWPRRLLVSAGLMLIAEVIALVYFSPMIVPPSPSSADGRAAASYLPGVVASPILLTAFLLGLATAGLALRSWPAWWLLARRFRRRGHAPASGFVHGAAAAILLGVGVLAFLLVLVQRPRSTSQVSGRHDVGRAGTGRPAVPRPGRRRPTLSSIVVLTAGDWLNGGRGASDLLSVPDLTEVPSSARRRRRPAGALTCPSRRRTCGPVSHPSSSSWSSSEPPSSSGSVAEVPFLLSTLTSVPTARSPSPRLPCARAARWRL